MKNGKKTAALALACLLLLAACGKKPAEAQQEASAPAAGTQTERTTRETALDQEVTVTIVEAGDTLEANGKYTGDMKNGKPDGHGAWMHVGDNGSLWRYEGEFTAGSFNGYGNLTILNSDGTSYRMEGNYTDGEYTPTTGQVFRFLGQVDYYGTFDLTGKQVDFIDEHAEWFPSCEKETAETIELQDFDYDTFLREVSQRQEGIIRLDLTANRVFEENVLNRKVMVLLASDDDNRHYSLFYFGDAELSDGDRITAYAMPCDTATFENVSGGITSVIVLLGCCIA